DGRLVARARPGGSHRRGRGRSGHAPPAAGSDRFGAPPVPGPREGPRRHPRSPSALLRRDPFRRRRGPGMRLHPRGRRGGVPPPPRDPGLRRLRMARPRVHGARGRVLRDERGPRSRHAVVRRRRAEPPRRPRAPRRRRRLGPRRRARSLAPARHPHPLAPAPARGRGRSPARLRAHGGARSASHRRHARGRPAARPRGARGLAPPARGSLAGGLEEQGPTQGPGGAEPMKITHSLAGGACLLVVLASAAARDGDAETAVPPPVVHGWGTFTPVAGADGMPVAWRPLSEGDDLPRFVYSRAAEPTSVESPPPQRVKPRLTAFVRLETPVVNFYAPGPMRVSFRADL